VIVPPCVADAGKLVQFPSQLPSSSIGAPPKVTSAEPPLTSSFLPLRKIVSALETWAAASSWI
jgi:hypothetical protein